MTNSTLTMGLVNGVLACQEVKVDFVSSFYERGMIHILKAVCGDLPPESITNMHCVCKSWSAVLDDCRISNRDAKWKELTLLRKIHRWQQLSKSCDNLLETELFRKISLPRNRNVIEVSHNFIFLDDDYNNNGHFWVQKLSGGSTLREFNGFNEDSFFTSCDFHLGSVNSNTFISLHYFPIEYFVWNYGNKEGTIILEVDNTDWQDHCSSYTNECSNYAQDIVFNSEYLMAILPSENSGLSASLKLFELSWGNGGQFTGKKLIDQMKNSWTIDMLQGSMYGRNLLLIDQRKGKVLMVTFEHRSLKKLWEHEHPYFVSNAFSNVYWTVNETNFVYLSTDQKSYRLFRIDQSNSCLTPIAAIEVPGLGNYIYVTGDLWGLCLLLETNAERVNATSLLPCEKLVEKEALSIPNLKSNEIALPFDSLFIPGGCKCCFILDELQEEIYVER